MRTFPLGFLAALVVLPIGALGYFRLGLAEVRSDVRPPAWESQLMHSAVHSAIRRRASGVQTPPSPNLEEAMIEGGKLYLDGCAGCHGEPGKPEEDLSHYPRVPQLAQAGTQYTEPEIHWIIQHGIRDTAMSAYGPFYSDQQIWALATFVRQIDRLPSGMLERIRRKPAPGGAAH